jgi:hypothetical protein
MGNIPVESRLLHRGRTFHLATPKCKAQSRMPIDHFSRSSVSKTVQICSEMAHSSYFGAKNGNTLKSGETRMDASFQGFRPALSR